MQRKALMALAAVAGVCGSALAGGPFPPGPGNWGPDITICQLYGITMNYQGQPQRSGDKVGVGMATTSWNIGTANAKWNQLSAATHPFIAQNVYQLKNQRFRQIGQGWVKHGFFALSNLQCGAHPYTGGGCSSTNGTALGVGCTDTYSSGLNMDQSGLGPRFEINPWTSGYSYTGSFMQTGIVPTTTTTGITRRVQLKDADLGQNVNQNNTATYVAEAYYVNSDDVDMMNSGGWKTFTVSGNSGGTYAFSMTGSSTDETSGYAVDYWRAQTGARLTMVAPQFPIVEDWSATNPPRPGNPAPGAASPDGRAIVGSLVIDLGGGNFRYEYVVFNLDMDRQIQSFTVPVPAGVTVSGIGFSSVDSANVPYTYSFHNGVSRVNGPPKDNTAWSGVRGTNNVSWSTPAHAAGVSSNPIAWGTMYSFWFEANANKTDGLVDLGLYKPGTPTSLSGAADVPVLLPPPFCTGDANGDGSISFADVTSVLNNFNATYTPGSGGAGDANNDGVVNFADVTAVLSSFNLPCP